MVIARRFVLTNAWRAKNDAVADLSPRMDALTCSLVRIDGDVQVLELRLHSMPRHRAALCSVPVTC